MYFKQFLHDETGCSSYFVASRDSREAAVVDPQLDIQPYLDLAAERDYRIIHVIDTHLHADHISGNRKLADATGAQLHLHEAADVLFPCNKLRDADVIKLGPVELRVVHTPGHRPESISILVVNPPRSPEPSMVLSGDTLFVGDVGRPDFGGPSGAEAEYRSVQQLLELPDYVEVFPAHFEGSCGKGMCGRPSSTIGFERRFNPVLQLSHDDFLRFENEVPPRPLNMSAIVETNRGAGEYGWVQTPGVAPVPTVSLDEAPGWISEQSPYILDVRESAEYLAGHLPGACLIPQSDLALRLGELPKDHPILVVCASGVRSLRAATFLHKVGVKSAVSLDGGTLGWKALGHPLRSGEAS